LFSLYFFKGTQCGIKSFAGNEVE